MIENESDCRGLIRKFAKELKRSHISNESIPILGAKVPILKIVELHTGIHMDISFNASDGYCAVKPIKQLRDKYPALKSLVIVIKAFLRQKDLNETHTGGIGSFLLVVLVTAFLQYHIKESQGDKKHKPLSELLIGFFTFYGEDFNYKKLGISIVGEGMLYRKPNNNGFLMVENPQDPDMDIGKPVREFESIAKIFIEARDTLKKNKMSLSSIINPISSKKKVKIH